MNSLIESELPGSQDLRDQLLNMITDQDLSCKLPGQNPTLGELCEEMGQIEQVYTHAFRTLKLDWSQHESKPKSTSSVAALQAWFAKLDADLIAVLSGFTEDDLHNRQLDRGYGFTPSLFVQFQIYHEALLIFYAKASVYLKALEKPVTDDWKRGIG